MEHKYSQQLGTVCLCICKIPLYKGISLFNTNLWTEFKDKKISLFNLSENDIVAPHPFKYTTPPCSFNTWLSQIKLGDKPEKYEYTKVTNLVKRPKYSENARRTADRREFNTFEDYYMVRNFFTFGMQTVKPNEIHVFATTNKRLDLYLVDPFDRVSFEDGFLPNIMEKYRNQHNSADIFKAKHPKMREFHFKKVEILQSSVRILEPNEKYMMISPQKTVFFFKIYTSDEFEALYGKTNVKKFCNQH